MNRLAWKRSVEDVVRASEKALRVDEWRREVMSVCDPTNIPTYIRLITPLSSHNTLSQTASNMYKMIWTKVAFGLGLLIEGSHAAGCKPQNEPVYGCDDNSDNLVVEYPNDIGVTEV
jgi:uncharacterized protein YjeT (DUF2065 family)